MDSKAVKALWLMGRAYTQLKEWEKAVDAITQACKVDPSNTEFRQELERVKKIKLSENQK